MIDFVEVYKGIKLKKSTKINEDKWLEFYKSTFDYIILGATFEPAKFGNQDEALKALEFLMSILKIKEIRFAIKWNVIGDEIDLSYYKPFFEIFNKHDAKICLNLGPIKTYRWPEIHLPKKYDKELKSLRKFPFVANIDAKIFKTSLNFLENLCTKIKLEFPDFIKNITMVQANNEAFNPFGVPNITLPFQHEIDCQKLLKKHFPSLLILSNSAGRYQLNKLTKIAKNTDYKNTFGLDFYYLVPENNYPILNNLDAISFGFPFNPSLNYFIKQVERTQNYFEFTEVQIESWGNITQTGDDIDNIKYVLTRIASYKPKTQSHLVLRLWGIEDLVNNYFKGSKKHIEIVKLISRINS